MKHIENGFCYLNRLISEGRFVLQMWAGTCVVGLGDGDMREPF